MMGGSSGNELEGASVTPTGVAILNLPVSASSRQRLESVAPTGACRGTVCLEPLAASICRPLPGLTLLTTIRRLQPREGRQTLAASVS